ncbi:MAG: hypothetical protein NTX66_04050 [Candidatus Falkowbacteria bacterium]|nr:hypothetical protein [Candidatus Falkowbacteria bacterium]
MINRKRALILILLVGLLIIAIIIYLVWFKKPVAPTPGAAKPINPALIKPEISTSTPGTKPRNYQKYDVSKEAPHLERFGSFSKQSNYGNIEDSKLFMTKDLSAWVDTYAAKLRSDHAAQTYYDIETKALSFKVDNFDAKLGKATVIVATLRRESTEAVNKATPYSQNLTLGYVRVDDNWLVNDVRWANK